MTTENYIEVDQRSGDGLTVTLLWDPNTNLGKVTVEDVRGESRSVSGLPPSAMKRTFDHPMVYVS